MYFSKIGNFTPASTNLEPAFFTAFCSSRAAFCFAVKFSCFFSLFRAKTSRKLALIKSDWLHANIRTSSTLDIAASVWAEVLLTISTSESESLEDSVIIIQLD